MNTHTKNILTISGGCTLETNRAPRVHANDTSGPGFLFTARINTNLVKTAIDDKFINHMAVFFKLKTFYKSSHIHNASYRAVSYLSGISINTLKKSLPFIINAGWCRRQGKGIILGSMTNLDSDNSPGKKILTFKIHKAHDYKYILKHLKLLLIKNCYVNFKYIKRLSTYRINPGNLTQLRIAKRAERKGRLKKLLSESDVFCVSTKKIGSLICRKRSTASRLISWGAKNNLLKKRSNVTPVNFVMEKDTPNIFFSGSKFFIRKPNYIIFN